MPRKAAEELVVITKTYDFILWSCHHTGKFPRNHRFVLGERIERYLYDLLETLIRAKYTKERRELLPRRRHVHAGRAYLDPLRDRADFKKLLADLKEKYPPPKNPARPPKK